MMRVFCTGTPQPAKMCLKKAGNVVDFTCFSREKRAASSGGMGIGAAKALKGAHVPEGEIGGDHGIAKNHIRGATNFGGCALHVLLHLGDIPQNARRARKVSPVEKPSVKI